MLNVLSGLIILLLENVLFVSSNTFCLKAYLTCWAFLVGQTVWNLPAMQETPGGSPWGRNITWGRKWPPTPVFLPREFHGQEPGGLQFMGVAESWTQLNCWHFLFTWYYYSETSYFLVSAGLHIYLFSIFTFP